MPNIDFNKKGYYSFYFVRNKNGVLNFMARTMFQFIYLDYGELVVEYSDQRIILKAGELLYFPPGIPWQASLGNTDLIKGVLFHLRSWPEVDELDYSPQVITVDESLKKCIYDMPIGDRKINSMYIWRTYKFLDYVQSYLTKNNNKQVKAIQNVLEFMRANDNYTIPQLVEISKMKKSTFYTVFKDLTGSTPVLMKQRFQAFKAEILLSTTDLTVEEVAHKMGFNSVAHFRKVFKSRYSVSPKKIRSNN